MGGCYRNVVANVLNCDMIVSEFESQLGYCVYFRTNAIVKSINLFMPQAVD